MISARHKSSLYHSEKSAFFGRAPASSSIKTPQATICMIAGVINDSTTAAMAIRGSTYRRKSRARCPASAAVSAAPYHSAISDCAMQNPSAEAMIKAGTSKIPWGTIAAAIKSAECPLLMISVTAPITIPFRLKITSVRMPKVAPPRKSRIQVSRLFAKIFRHISTGFSMVICPAISFWNRESSSFPIAGLCTVPIHPTIMEMIKRRIVTVVVVPRRERSECGDTPGSDIKDHPDHVANTRGKADHDHCQKHQVPEGRVRLLAIELHDIDSREENDQLERVHDKCGTGHRYQV